MGQCNSTNAGSNAVDPSLVHSKSHLYAQHLEDEAKKVKKNAPLPHSRAINAIVNTATATDPLEIFSYNGALMTASGARFYLKGINWFGFEGANRCVQGLWAQPLSFFLNFLVTNGFNAIRLPLCAQTCLNMDDTTNMPTGFDTNKNPQLVGQTWGGVLDYFMQQCASLGIWVMPDMHALTIANGIQDPLWYNSTVSEAQFIQAWINVVTRYKNQWNLIGCDLRNELHGSAAWHSGNTKYDWDTAAVKTGNAILAINPKVLIFVEGTCGNNYPVETSANAAGFWWGGDLSSAAKAPIQFNTPNKLVYSPHCYGPTVYVQSYFDAPDFPNNMPAIWTSQYGFILANKPLLGPALVIGEWGGQDIDSSGKADKTWHTAFATYMQQLGMTDQFYWCLNPTSSDTGGVLEADWATPVEYKLSLLAEVVPQPGKVIVSDGKPTAISPGNGQPVYSFGSGSTTPSPPVTTAPPTTMPPTSQPPIYSATFTLTPQVVSTWSDSSSGALLSQINYTLTNTSTSLAMCTLGNPAPETITQIWSITQTTTVTNGLTVFDLPSWALQAGGVAAGASLSFGGTFNITHGSPTWTILSA